MAVRHAEALGAAYRGNSPLDIAPDSKDKGTITVGRARNWTKEEDTLLAENWGHMSVPGLCKKLNRTKNAIMVRVQRLGLPPYLEAGEYITLNQLLIAVTGTNSAYSYKMTSWVKNRGLPVHNKRNNQRTWRVVYIDEFWEWAEKNRAFLDFSKMEPLALGKEPDWVADQRRRDYHAFAHQRKDPWTPAEDNRLLHLLRQYKYSWSEIARLMNRSAGAIQRRCCDLGIKERPIKANNHNPWSDADFEILADGIKNGLSYTDIGDMVGRSEKAVRGRVYETYRTENADKVRAMMGDGAWGAGKPSLTVWDKRCKAAVRRDLSALVGLIKIYRNTLEFGEFWQRQM
ncbi:MAG: SANT/Myb-like DNA-binding domain-containing protein, partial [Syntrophomonadaceae bacterium]|nr:SANT/Myb-like DNA-binding domain-containing protein [Syntrophomonadaceae bacterium]